MFQPNAHELLGVIAFILNMQDDDQQALTERVRAISVSSPRSIEDILTHVLYQVSRGVSLDVALAQEGE